MLRIPLSKIAVPPLPVGFSSRPDVLAHLDEHVPGQLLLVSAPAGYGKTLALSDWVRRSGPATAWVTVDREDDSPRLRSALLSALATLSALPADSSLRRASRFDTQIGPGDFVDHVVDAMETAGAPLRLVLDDVHLLADGEPKRDLARLVHRRPANLHLVLSSRVDPSVSLPRLRLEGQVHELRVEQLRFSRDEAAAVLRTAGLDLAPDLVTRLQERTEGWAAGLRLAAIALRRADDPAAFVESFSGDERSMADYLTGELLVGLPPETLDFLRAVSVCAELSTGLAVALTDRQDAARSLDELVRETALIERQASGTYRIHPLLRTYLAANLERHQPAQHRRLHATAARWWSAAGEPEHALLHAAQSGDGEQLGGLLRRSAVLLLLRGEFAAIRAALDLVRPEERSADPWIGLVAALVHVHDRALPAAAAELRHARSAWPPDAGPDLRMLRDGAELLGRCVGLVTEQVPVPDDLDTAPPELRILLHAGRGTAELAPEGGADAALARRDLDSALRLARARGLAYAETQILCTVALLAAVGGDYGRMAGAAEEAVRVASRHGRHPSAWTARASAVLGYVDLLSGNPSSARRWAATALGTDPDLPPETLYALRIVHAAARADEGDPAGFTEIQAAGREGSGPLWPPPVPAALAVLEHRVALTRGNLAAAGDVVVWLEKRVGRVAEVFVMEARAALAGGRPEVARTAVEPVTARSLPVLLPDTMIEALLIAAEIALRAGDVATGTVSVDRALALGRPPGIVRPFLLAGPRTRDHLQGRPGARGRSPFATRLAEAWTGVHADAATPLSERELVVLGLLPSLLSAGEIADELTVSVNTVKSHIRSIYTKLGASSRREAVQRARERALLS